jgi:hypothetical protein
VVVFKNRWHKKPYLSGEKRARREGPIGVRRGQVWGDSRSHEKESVFTESNGSPLKGILTAGTFVP